MLFTQLLAQAEDAVQQTSQRSQPTLFDTLGPFLIMGVLAFFLLVLPWRRQEKQRQALVSALKKNDKIINSGGIIGIVESVKDKENEVVLKGGLRVTKTSIVQIVADDSTKEQKEVKS